MLKSLTFMIFLSSLYGIVPPKDGKLSSQILENLKNQNIGNVYGDPGWVSKILNLRNEPGRNTQLEFFMPVILGKYADVSNTYFNATDYDNMLFGNNPTGSLTNYYDEISYGNFEIDGSVSGWYQSSLTKSQAVENVRQYVSELASLADSDIDYGLYDNDGPDNIPNSGDDDGYVDGLAVVYQGCLSGSDNIWAHQSSLGSSQYISNDQAPNGDYIIINSYMVCPELPGSGDCITNEICPMGIYAHEFGHILGLPDLYDREESDGDSEGLGEWCLMASGSWLGWYGDTPSHMSSWCKIKLGWLEPSIATSPSTNVPIAQLATSPSALMIWEDDYRSSRYFLVENRQHHGFDSDLNGVGLLVYHVDENRTAGFDSFGLNNDDENNKLIDLEASDGETDLDDNINRGDAGDPFPGSTGNTMFNANTNPSSNRNDGFITQISIENISEPDSLMYADISPMSNTGYTVLYDEFGIAPTALTIGTEEQWAGVHFTSINEGYLTEIDFGLVWEVFWNADQINWDVNVYNSFDGVSPGSLFQTVSGTSFIGGWETVGIDSFPVSANQDFFIGVKFYNNGYVYAYDNQGELSGRSYYSSNGIGYDNNLSNYGDSNIRAKISTETYVKSYEESVSPENFGLMPNYPNPFNPGTTISFALEESANVILDIFDINGRNIETLVNKNLLSGNHKYHWDASKFPSGVYIVRVYNNKYYDNQKIMLLK